MKLLIAGRGSVIVAADYGRIFLVCFDLYGVAKLDPLDIAEVGLGFF